MADTMRAVEITKPGGPEMLVPTTRPVPQPKPGEVLIESAVSRFGSKSVHIRQRTSSGGSLTAEGLSVLALIDRETRRAVVLDDGVRAAFARWTLPGA